MTFDILTSFVIFLCMGCGSSMFDSGPHSRSPEYSIGFANRTKEQLSGVESEWAINGIKYTPDAGMLGPGSEKQYRFAPDPIPPAATVVWTTPDGKEHYQKFEIPKNIRDDAFWTGTIWFRFSDKGVEIIPLSKKQMDDLADAHKKYP